MNKIIKRMMLVPLLAALVIAPMGNKARADGIGWWWVPIIAGGVVLYYVMSNNADDSYQKTSGAQPPVDYQPQVVLPPTDYQPVNYTASQYGYQLAYAPEAMTIHADTMPQGRYICPSNHKYYPQVHSCDVDWELAAAAPHKAKKHSRNKTASKPMAKAKPMVKPKPMARSTPAVRSTHMARADCP